MDEYKVDAEDIEPHIVTDRNVALQQFQQACGRGVWAEVWWITGKDNALKIADFPGIVT
jgi:hypothetical protein